MNNLIELQLQGDRNYIDIAQISYKALQSLGIDITKNEISDFSISVFKPFGKKVEIRQRLTSPIDQTPAANCLGQFHYSLNSILHNYEMLEVDSSLPSDMGIAEPDFSHHWQLKDDRLLWLLPVESQWPVFFAYMLMGRLAGIHFYGGEKPKGLTYNMKRIPRPDEIKYLWVRKKRGPINGLAVIELHCGSEFIGLSKLKI